MATIKNESELLSVMEEAAREALEAVTEEVLRLFKSAYIRKYVYGSHGKNIVYYDGSRKPTYEFEDAWVWTEIKKQLKSLVTTMWYDPSNMKFHMNTFLHGSKYSTPPDVRDNLPAILEGKQSSLWLSVYRPIKFYEKFIEDMFDKGELEKIIIKHFEANGFKKI